MVNLFVWVSNKNETSTHHTEAEWPSPPIPISGADLSATWDMLGGPRSPLPVLDTRKAISQMFKIFNRKLESLGNVTLTSRIPLITSHYFRKILSEPMDNVTVTIHGCGAGERQGGGSG